MKTNSKLATQPGLVSNVEQEFVASALAKVRSPEFRYWLTMGFDTLATALSAVERENDQSLAKLGQRTRKQMNGG